MFDLLKGGYRSIRGKIPEPHTGIFQPGCCQNHGLGFRVPRYRPEDGVCIQKEPFVKTGESIDHVGIPSKFPCMHMQGACR